MNKSIKSLQVFEHQTLKVDDDPRFCMSHFNALEKYGYKTNQKYYMVGNKRIKFANYVGVIQVNNLTIEVLPKADYLEYDQASKDKWHNTLISMLHECRLIKLNSIYNAKLKIKSASILDLYYDLFLTETEKIFIQGLRKNYKPVRENLNKVKGKILFSDHIKKNAFHKERFYVEHKLYTVNNKLNQIIYKALTILAVISSNPNLNVRINKLLLNLENITEENVTSEWFGNIKYNRNTERYRQAITLAKLIILHYSPDLKGGNENVLAIMFDMNALYENYIYRKLKVIQFDENIPVNRVNAQNRKPFWESRGLRADIVVETDKKNIIIDTKWKILKEIKPSDNDIQQMLLYNLHYNADLSILMYPKTTLETTAKKPYKDSLFRDKNCQVAFVNLFTENNKLDNNLGYNIYNELIKSEIV